MTIRVGFSHAVGFWSFLSKIIMGATGRPYSHCWLLLTGDDGIRGKDVVLTEDENGGLHFVPWVGYGAGKTIVKILNSPYDLGPGVDALLGKLGTGYDIAGLVGESWVLAVQRWFHRKTKNPLANAGEMWCSEAVFFALEQVPAFKIPAGSSIAVTPADVDDALTQAGGTVYDAPSP